MRKPIIAANWKMHKTLDEAKAFFAEIAKEEIPTDVDVLLCLPSLYVAAGYEACGQKSILFGTQNMYFEEKGAFTGELSPTMIQSVGCSYVILGHSERRELFGEDDVLINQKVKSAFTHNITPILCVGETLETRNAGKAKEYVTQQLQKDLAQIEGAQVDSMVIAYEPIWAIGTGITASPEDAEEMCVAIRQEVERLYDASVAQSLRIQYGGSVKESNAVEILKQENIDGALVGGASLAVKDFLPIIKSAQSN